MALLLIALGGLALSAAVGLVVYRTLQNRSATGRLDVGLLAAGAVALVAGLLLDTNTDSIWDREEWLAALAALLVLVGGIVTGVGHLVRRDVSPKGRRGLVAIGAGVLLVAATLLIPALATQRELPDQLADLETTTPGATLTSMERARGVFDAVVDVIAAETGLDADTVATNLDEGISVAEMVREADGDLDAVVEGIAAILTEQVQETVASGRMTDFEASLLISQMQTIVRFGVETDLTGALSRFEEPTPESTAAP